MILVRILFTLLLIGPIIPGVINYAKNREEPALKKESNYVALINSAGLYAIPYNVIFLIQELFLVVGKNSLGLTAYLYHNNHSWDGEHPMASLMQGSGALAIFLVGSICLAGLHAVRHSPSIWKVLLL